MNFASQLLYWFYGEGRKHLPWQKDINPYRVWVAEIMLQQTQVATVIPYYQRFMARFPDLKSLAESPVTEVLKYWAGLGYYARGRNLHKTAVIIQEQFGGEFPQTAPTLISLPGIGKSTAHAILSIAFNQKLAILDGNVKRVLTRFKGINDYAGLPHVEKELWEYAAQLLPDTEFAAYTQAIMDLGAMICTKNNPSCLLCPVNQGCFAFLQHLTDEIPAAKPQRKYPTKTQICLLLYDAKTQKIFLERRKDSGIWGGLHAPLFFDDVTAFKAWSKKARITFNDKQILPERVHKFTHFQLKFTPWLLRAEHLPAENLQAHALDDLANLALPTPIKSLLEELKNALIITPNLF